MSEEKTLDKNNLMIDYCHDEIKSMEHQWPKLKYSNIKKHFIDEDEGHWHEQSEKWFRVKMTQPSWT